MFRKKIVPSPTFHKSLKHDLICKLHIVTSFFFSNVAEALVSKGFGTVIRYRQDDDQRSSHYDELLAAEERARKKAVGLHSKKDNPTHRVADVSGVIVFSYQL